MRESAEKEEFCLAELGLAGLQFVRHRLTSVKRCEGGVLDSVGQVEPLRAYAFSRDAATARSETDFTQSNPNFRKNSEATECLVGAWLREADEGVTRVVSIEDRYETSETHLWKQFGEVLFDKTPYLVVTQDDDSSDSGVALTLGGHEDVAILSEVPGPFSVRSELTRYQIDALAEGIAGAVVWAWDSEGAILVSARTSFDPRALAQ